ncbi:modification methylase Cfr9I [Asticcacaulis biprosthecium C19]|uniref:Methyltransferase n=1 Tax=Asticcacaulis biprosthecium C19 TaxID=715226 RepID=F4QJ07_9CAUL|nr:site-specific DNA-methyltransferase [Asticcacaulis biprosthecium]EGF93070.1 modification methylase Cfr9I [Asticcacaulis biprosthecium C19]
MKETNSLMIGGVSMYLGECRDVLRTFPDNSVDCCVSSPPYYQLRDYRVAGQIGLEASPQAFIAVLVEVFREVHRVLKPSGTLWINIGDSYASKPNGSIGATTLQGSRSSQSEYRRTNALRKTARPTGLKHKDLMGMPWRLAFALQEDGWYLRQDIIWNKLNPMPESVEDRCTKSHEYIFLLSKSARYFFDQEAILEPCSPSTNPRFSQDIINQVGSARANGGTRATVPMKAVGRKFDPGAIRNKSNENFDSHLVVPPTKRNKRSVWSIGTRGFSGAHFATYPVELIEPCILAGCPAGGIVLDPFGGSGTTAIAAHKHGRKAVYIDLNPEYFALARDRIDKETSQANFFDRTDTSAEAQP